MRNIKKTLASLLALIMILTAACPAFAAVKSYDRPEVGNADAVKVTGLWSFGENRVDIKIASKEGEVKAGWYYLNQTNNSSDYKWFCFDEQGNMRTGWINDKFDDTVWYYMSEVKDKTEGSLMTGWVKDPQDGH